jgi:hypothetical protein
MEMEEKNYKHKPPLLQVKSKFAVIVMIHATSQLAMVAILPARPFIFTGSICKG